MKITDIPFTNLQSRILRLLCIHAGGSLNMLAIARRLDVTSAAVSKALEGLKQTGLITAEQDRESKRFSISLADSKKAIRYKRAENLRMLYESGLADVLEETYPGAAIILFGSYARGEDTTRSDIDIAIIGAKEKPLTLSRHEKALQREIRLEHLPSLDRTDARVKANILGGIPLSGSV